MVINYIVNKIEAELNCYMSCIEFMSFVYNICNNMNCVVQLHKQLIAL